jgi:hypothetical protein
MRRLIEISGLSQAEWRLSMANRIRETLRNDTA